VSNQVADNECQEDERQPNTSADTNEVSISTSKIKNVSFTPNPGKDQHNQDQDQLQDPQDALEGAEVVALAPNRPGEVPARSEMKDDPKSSPQNLTLSRKLLPQHCWFAEH
jgi:hypothetical protein